MRDFEEIKREFDTLGICTDDVEFYNSKEFLAAEKNNPILLEAFAEFVVQKSYQEQYLERSRRIVPAVCEFLKNELILDGRLGACIDFAQTTGKIFEELNIWCVTMCGSLTVELGSGLNKSVRHWAHVSEPPVGSNAAGHAWLVAPPFNVIDMTIGLQKNTTDIQQLLPNEIIEEKTKYVEKVTLRDMLNVDLEMKLRLSGHPIPTIEELLDEVPDYARVLKKFKPFSVCTENALLKYFPCAVNVLVERFDFVTTHCFSGQTASELLSKMQREIGEIIQN